MRTIREAYGQATPAWRQTLPDSAVVGLAVAAAAGAWIARPFAAVLASCLVATVLLCVDRRANLLVALVVIAVGALVGVRADSEWHALRPRHVGPVDATGRVIAEPAVRGGASRVLLEIDGQRFEAWVRGRAGQRRVADWRGGDLVHVHGELRELPAHRVRRVAWEHVVGELELEWSGDRRPGSAIDRASNRVRAAIERGSAHLPAAEAALFRGLVVGDDRDQPPEMVDRFRASGLSHLTAVSGQNVAFLLAAAGPLLRNLRPWPRLIVSVALIGWYVSVTRFEPSIVRAGAMAAIAAAAYVTGRERAPGRVLCIAVAFLFVIDPLLVVSVGFWLSVGATAGVGVVGPWLSGRLAVFGPVAGPLGLTLGAQAGVAVPSLLVFGRLPLVSVPANLLAVPVAGAVMLYGLPAGLVAGAVPALAPALMLPVLAAVRWVDTVAALGARLEPGGSWPIVGWAVVTVAVLVLAATTRSAHGRLPPHR